MPRFAHFGGRGESQAGDGNDVDKRVLREVNRL